MYLQRYDKLVNITKQGAPFELMRKKKKRKQKIAKSNAGKTLERWVATNSPPISPPYQDVESNSPCSTPVWTGHVPCFDQWEINKHYASKAKHQIWSMP